MLRWDGHRPRTTSWAHIAVQGWHVVGHMGRKKTWNASSWARLLCKALKKPLLAVIRSWAVSILSRSFYVKAASFFSMVVPPCATSLNWPTVIGTAPPESVSVAVEYINAIVDRGIRPRPPIRQTRSIPSRARVHLYHRKIIQTISRIYSTWGLLGQLRGPVESSRLGSVTPSAPPSLCCWGTLEQLALRR